MSSADKYFLVRQDAGVKVVELTRDVGDTFIAERLKHELAAYIDEVGPVDLVVALENLATCPSALIAALIATRRRLAQYGGRMKLSIPSDHIRFVFERLNLTVLFEIYGNRETAVHAFREGPNSISVV